MRSTYEAVVNDKSIIFYVHTDTSLAQWYEQYKTIIESVVVKIS